MNQNEALKAEAEKVYAALQVMKKPQMQTRRLLVGHEYLASHVVERYDVKQPITVPDIAISLAKRLAFEKGDGVPNGAEQYVFIVEQGYVVTFAWIEWVEDEVKQTADITHLGRLSTEYGE